MARSQTLRSGRDTSRFGGDGLDVDFGARANLHALPLAHGGLVVVHVLDAVARLHELRYGEEDDARRGRRPRCDEDAPVSAPLRRSNTLSVSACRCSIVYFFLNGR